MLKRKLLKATLGISVALCCVVCAVFANSSASATIISSDRVINTEGPLAMSTDVIYPETLWDAPEFEYETSLDFGMEDTEGVKGIFFTSPITYNGKPTKVAAYIGFPEGASAENKVPAIVLVHGGLGTAIPQWVKYWNDLGFAAISLDTEGGEPINGISNYDTLNYHIERNRYAGGEEFEAGPTNTTYQDWEKPVEQQWMYHATSATISAVSLISSFDCVDTKRVGMTGISWGSVITSNVVSYDDRVSFAMPVYGGLSVAQSYGDQSTRHPNEESAARWDTLEGLQKTACKMYFVTSDADYHFSMDIADRSAQAARGSVNFKNGFSHGQAEGAYEENLPIFAKHVCGMDTPFVEITKQPTRDNASIKVKTYGDTTVDSVWLYYTSSETTSSDAKWYTKFVSFDDASEYQLEVPDGTTYAYVRIRYNEENTICSYVF